MKKILFILAIVLLASCGQHKTASRGPADWIWVATTGDDVTGDGTAGNPYESISHAITQASAGDTVYITAGTYNVTTQIVVPVEVSLMGEGVTSIINSTYVNASAVQGAIHLASTAGTAVNGNQSISYIRLLGDNLTSSRAIYIGYRNNIEIHHCTIEDFEDSGIYCNGSRTTAGLYITGIEIHDNIINNCSGTAGYLWASILLHGTDGILIYNNSFDNRDRPTGENGSTLEFWKNKNHKVYNNTFYRNDHEITSEGVSNWNFFLEEWNYNGNGEFYDNTLYGLAQLSLGGTDNDIVDDCTFGYKIYGNSFLNAANGNRDINGGDRTAYAITIEGDQHKEVYVYNNYIQRYGWGIALSTPKSGEGYWAHYWDWDGVYIYYNIIENIGYADHAYSHGIVIVMGTDNAPYYGIYDNILITNNVITGNNGGTYPGYYGIYFNADGTFTGLQISNNIVYGFTNNAVDIREQGGGTCVINDVDITYNDFYSNGTDAVVWNAAVDYTNRDIATGNITDNPLFKSNETFRLRPTSPAINAGVDVNLTTDYWGHRVPQGAAPDIGACEFGNYVLFYGGKQLY